MKKTFWTVEYGVWGLGGTRMATFENKKDAMNFYDSNDHVDAPVAHACSKEETIKMYENMAAETRYELNGMNL